MRISSAYRVRSAAASSRFCLLILRRNCARSLMISTFRSGGKGIGADLPKVATSGKIQSCA